MTDNNKDRNKAGCFIIVLLVFYFFFFFSFFLYFISYDEEPRACLNHNRKEVVEWEDLLVDTQARPSIGRAQFLRMQEGKP